MLLRPVPLVRRGNWYVWRRNRHVLWQDLYLHTARGNMQQLNVELQCGVDFLVLPYLCHDFAAQVGPRLHRPVCNVRTVFTG